MNKHSVTAQVQTTSLAAAVLAAVLLIPAPFVAAAADEARAIVEEAQKRTTSKSERYEGLLKTVDAGGKITEKSWLYERIGAHGQSKSVIRFTEPAEVRGVTLLIVNHAERASDQWMWTPSIERDRRIALQDRSTRFFGTDFSFEDLDERDVNQYDYVLLGDENIAGAACWMIQSTPKQSKGSQYSKAVFWIRKDNHAYARGDFWVKDAVVRRLTYNDLRVVQGIWTAHDLTMTDLRRNSRTQLMLSKVQYNLPLRDGDFTLEGIRR
jgi:outer membrane lipoprotein-sorting protein